MRSRCDELQHLQVLDYKSVDCLLRVGIELSCKVEVDWWIEAAVTISCGKDRAKCSDPKKEIENTCRYEMYFSAEHQDSF